MFALQFGLPGGPELLILGLLFLVLPFVFAYYVYTDAEARGEENAALWALAAGLAALVASPIGGLLVVVVYIWQRDEKQPEV
ncbi:hypothetical protein [Natronomonas sp.]|uniref:hypothetical protein n=1 Tax=Natronomonas sp. TaxID=2184060 RepID=UPI002FC38861